MICPNTQQYLDHYAEQEFISLAKIQGALAQHPYRAALIIPAYNESPAYLKRWMRHPQAEHHLLITVVNSPQSALHKSPKNIQLWQFIEDHFQLQAQQDNLYFFVAGTIKLLAVDRFSNKTIPDKQGVGLARKIACDLSVFLFRASIQQLPWIFSSDADAHLPDNYFSAISHCTHTELSPTPSSALVMNFEHVQAEAPLKVFAATQMYEQAIKYFCQQLSYAESPYAFYTLGSTLALHIPAYVKVRGFPKRAGGEDFYILNKLAKTGNILLCPHITIQIEARTSQRVPFGTGPAVSKIIEQNQEADSYGYYAPEIFQELKQWLALSSMSSQLWQNRATPECIPWTSVNCEHTMQRLNLPKFLQHAKQQCKSEAVFKRAFHHWFDGFMTLKFVHDMQRHYYPPRALQECLQAARQYHHPGMP